MDLKTFENLALIPELLNKIELLEKRINDLLPSINNKKEVIKYLDISNSTFYNYINQNILQNGYHYIKKNNKYFFYEDKIIELKSNLKVGVYEN